MSRSGFHGPQVGRISLALALVIAATLAAACNESGEAPSSAALADSVRLEEVTRVGCVGYEGPEALSLSYVALKPDGTLYVVDKFEPFVRVFDLEGQLVRALGPSGEGPGDLGSPGMPGFEAPIGLYFAADGTLLVHDLQPPRISRFDLDGTFLETINWGADVHFPLGRGYDPSHGRLYSAWHGVAMFDDDPRPRVDRIDLADPEPVTILIGEEHFPSSTTPNGDRADFPFAVGPDGRFAMGDYWRYEIREFDAEGAPLNVFGRDIARPQRTDEELAEARAKNEKRSRRAGRPAREVSPEKPHFDAASFDYDDAGRLWVRTLRGTGEETIFDVFDPSGSHLGQVVIAKEIMSGEILLTKPFDVSGDYLAAAFSDAQGNEFVQVWRLIWP